MERNTSAVAPYFGPSACRFALTATAPSSISTRTSGIARRRAPTRSSTVPGFTGGLAAPTRNASTLDIGGKKPHFSHDSSVRGTGRSHPSNEGWRLLRRGPMDEANHQSNGGSSMSRRTAALRRLALLTLVTVVGFAAVQLPAAAAPASATVVTTGDVPVSGRAPAAAGAAKGATRAANAKTRIGISSGGTLPWASDADLARELDGYARSARPGFGSTSTGASSSAPARGPTTGLYTTASSPATPAGSGSSRSSPTRPDGRARRLCRQRQVRAGEGRRLCRLRCGRGPSLRVTGREALRALERAERTAFWLPAPNAARYTALVRAAYGRMKAIDPSITVLAGATSPASDDGPDIDPRTFLRQVYANGGGGSFDAWSHHPYYGPNHSGRRLRLVGLVPDVRDEAVAPLPDGGQRRRCEEDLGDGVGRAGRRHLVVLRDDDGGRTGRPATGGARPLARLPLGRRPHVLQLPLGPGWSLTRDDWSPRPAWFAYRDSVPRR